MRHAHAKQARMVMGLVLAVAFSVGAARPCLRTPMPETVRGATMMHVGDLEDDDPRNDGKRGYGTRSSRSMLEKMKAMDLDLVSLVTVATLKDVHDTSVQTHFSTPGRATSAALLKTMEEARTLGLRVMLVPHLQILDGTWRGELTYADSVHSDAFFSSLRAYVLRVATLAEQGCADVLSISLELKGLSQRPANRARFVALIQAVRQVFKGQVTYSANWDEAAQVTFWDAVDVVGVNAFYPLQQKPGASVEDLRLGAAEMREKLEALHTRTHKRVLLTEFGFASTTDAALRPWEWPLPKAPVDGVAQQNAYHAVLCALQGQPWNAGAVAWLFPSDPDDAVQPRPYDPPNGFSPLNKPAQAVLSAQCR